jgi:predicted SAM-dependent methyltransferase
MKVNLCNGNVRVEGYTNIDICGDPDILIDLEERLLPFAVNSVEVLVCNGAIGYFTQSRAQEIIKDIFRVLIPGGVTRFGTQDLIMLMRKYIECDYDFYFAKLDNGKDRFPGRTYCEKLNEWFYGHYSGKGKHCKYVYDYETLKLLFGEAGFSQIEKMNYQRSRIHEVNQIDNRREQFFYLEAIK